MLCLPYPWTSFLHNLLCLPCPCMASLSYNSLTLRNFPSPETDRKSKWFVNWNRGTHLAHSFQNGVMIRYLEFFLLLQNYWVSKVSFQRDRSPTGFWYFSKLHSLSSRETWALKNSLGSCRTITSLYPIPIDGKALRAFWGNVLTLPSLLAIHRIHYIGSGSWTAFQLFDPIGDFFRSVVCISKGMGNIWYSFTIWKMSWDWFSQLQNTDQRLTIWRENP